MDMQVVAFAFIAVAYTLVVLVTGFSTGHFCKAFCNK